MLKLTKKLRRLSKHLLTVPVLSVLAVAFAAGIVYAAVSVSATGGGAVTQITTSWGDCKNITNNNGLALFVPANTQAEWNAFINYAPNKTLAACCTANSGQSCTSSANSCGQTNTGTYSCAGVCSASTPANPAGYGNACSSSANACGQTNSGTIQCNGTCSASTPANPAGYGNACTSAPNACGQTNSGTIQCNGTCSATTPANSCGKCTITIQAGGLGGGGAPGGPYSVNYGYGISIDNTTGTSACGLTVSPNQTGLSSYTGPTYSVPAGSSYGEGPFGSKSNVSVPYLVSINASSVTCPAGTNLSAPSGLTASCSMSLTSSTNVGSCSDQRIFTCQ